MLVCEETKDQQDRVTFMSGSVMLVFFLLAVLFGATCFGLGIVEGCRRTIKKILRNISKGAREGE